MLRHFLVALVALCPCLLHAQVTGFSYELDTVFAANEPSDLANYGVHYVYANLTSATDVVSSVFPFGASKMLNEDHQASGLSRPRSILHNPPKALIIVAR